MRVYATVAPTGEHCPQQEGYCTHQSRAQHPGACEGWWQHGRCASRPFVSHALGVMKTGGPFLPGLPRLMTHPCLGSIHSFRSLWICYTRSKLMASCTSFWSTCQVCRRGSRWMLPRLCVCGDGVWGVLGEWGSGRKFYLPLLPGRHCALPPHCIFLFPRRRRRRPFFPLLNLIFAAQVASCLLTWIGRASSWSQRPCSMHRRL